VLADQLRRAATSVPLNLQEAAYSQGGMGGRGFIPRSGRPPRCALVSMSPRRSATWRRWRRGCAIRSITSWPRCIGSRDGEAQSGGAQAPGEQSPGATRRSSLFVGTPQP
jgi:hypothetical protein